MVVSPGDLVLQEADIVDVEHDAQVEVRVLSIFVKLLLQRPIQLNPSETRIFIQILVAGEFNTVSIRIE